MQKNQRKQNIHPHHIPKTWTLFYVVFYLCVAFTLSAPQTIFASSLDKEKDRLDEIKDQIKATTKLQSVKEKQAAVIQQQLYNITAEADVLENKIDTNKGELQKTKDAIDRIRKDIAQQERALSGQRKVLSQLIRTQYESGTETFAARLLLPRALAFSTNDYMTQTQDKIHTTITRIDKLRIKMKKDHVVLEKKKDDVEDTKKKLEKRNDALESARINKAYLVSRTKNEIKTYQKKITQLEQEQVNIRREIERIELAKLDGVNLANLPSKKKANFDYPVDNVRITQYYGRTSFSVGAYPSGLHNGVDFGGGGSIRAAADGTVIATGNMGRYGYGRWAAIDHGNGLVTLYGHMSKVKVDSGDKIDKGDKMGTMGTTGYSTGVHLHFTVFAASSFEVVKSSSVSGLKVPTGASVNPMIYL